MRKTFSRSPYLTLAGSLALASISAGPASAAEVTSPQVTALIEGKASGNLPLSAQVDVEVESPSSALIEITNTTPASSSTVPGAPVLTRLGFNLAGSPPASCLVLEDASNRFGLTSSPTPFCGTSKSDSGCKGKKSSKGSKGKKGKKGGKWGWGSWGGGSWGGGWSPSEPEYEEFEYGLDAKSPSPKKGIKAGESLVIRLSIKPSCTYQFSPDSFLDAPLSPTSGELAQWAAKFQVVGKWGEDSGCGNGDNEEVEEPQCTPIYTWSEFIATSADLNGLPSAELSIDSRAGSVELNFNGGHGFNGLTNEAPYSAGILTLRNGKSTLLEQVQINRFNTPGVLDANGCSIGSPYPQCWIFYPLNAVAELLSAIVPTMADSSNQYFDDSGLRVEISGEIHMDFSADEQADNSHQWMEIEWNAPLGLDTAQLLLRGRYDWDLNYLGSTDVFIPIFHRNIAALGPDAAHPSVIVLEETNTKLRIAIDVQGATQYVCEDYLGKGLITLTGGPK